MFILFYSLSGNFNLNVYILLFFRPALLAVILCFSITSIIGAALLFASGGFYGIIALGRK
jgi:hypothetical protein